MPTEDPTRGLIEATQTLVRTGVLSFSGHGNASTRTDAGIFLTSRSSFVGLTVDGLALVDPDGGVLEGTVEPANLEIVEMHAAVYRMRPDVGAIIHTHSPHVTAWALAWRPLPSRYESTIRFGIVDDIPVAPWAPRGSPEAVRHITETLQAHSGTLAVLLANHGLLALGPSPMETARLVVALEEAALMTREAEMLGGARPFPDGAVREVRDRMARFGA